MDKSAIDRSTGLQWKQSFYKNVCGRAYGKLMRAYTNLHVRADPYGDKKFKDSFAKYIERNHRPTLFDRGTFEFVEEDDVAVQLPDIVCGLLARCYDPDRLLAKPEELLRLLIPKVLLIDEWPPRYRVTPGQTEFTSEANDAIAEYSLSRAEGFILEHETASDPNTICQVATLERLVLERRFGSEKASVSTGELIDSLQSRELSPKGESWFRLNVIGPLRDHGVLVTSSSSGYKLPTSPEDLEAFLGHAQTVCVPMLRRVVAACDAVKLATQGRIDVLATPEQSQIRRLVEALDEGSGIEVQAGRPH